MKKLLFIFSIIILFNGCSFIEPLSRHDKEKITLEQDIEILKLKIRKEVLQKELKKQESNNAL